MRAGVVLQARYEIVGTLGAGGQGTVFEAVDRRLGIRVAVKRSVQQREQLRQAFVREARLLASLRHPCLPIVSDFFLVEAADVADPEQHGQYLVMELVPGEDLESRVHRQGGPCAVAEVLDWADQLLDALEYIHGQTPPVLHRDIKPRNLKLRPDGRLIVLDFGLAKGRPLQDQSFGPLLSLGGYSHGFAPIEQVFMQGTDPRSDLYAVGATLYFLLSGSAPPDATARDRQVGVSGDPLRPLEQLNPRVPGQVAGLIHHALELIPERRFQSAAAMRRALASARADLEPAPALPPARPRHAAVDPDLPTVVPMPQARATTAPEPVAGEVGPHPPTHQAGPHPPTPSLARGRGGEGSGGEGRPPLPGAAGQPPVSGGEARPAAALLALAHGDQTADRWPLRTDRPITIGRSAAGAAPPDVDLWPDRRVSREHARVRFADGHWWIEDAGSKHGTRLDGRSLTPGQPALLRPWAEIELGDTVLFLTPPGWHRLYGRGIAIDLDAVGAVSSSLAHAGLPIVGRVVARGRAGAARPAGRLELALEPCIEPLVAALPPLAPRASAVVSLPPVVPRYDVLEGQIEQSRRRLLATVDGEVPQAEPIECLLLPHNEWSTLPEHQPALATFVLPNHPAVAAICLDVVSTIGPDAPTERVAQALYAVLAERWQIAYRVEPPHWAVDGQKIRLPHQVLSDDATRQGEGTCLDLAVLVAACLENLGLQPLVAVVDLGDCWHALTGCWDPAGAALEPLLFDADRLLAGSIWLDPTGLTRDPEARRPFAAARTAAEEYLRSSPLVFALDVAAARQGGITPLPFAGTPSWSPGAARAIEAARSQAQAAGGQVCSAALLAGLVAAGDRLTARLADVQLGGAERARAAIVAALPPARPGAEPTPGFRQVLNLARSRAKDAGSPVVLEGHLLGALLAVRSASLERALGRLGSDQQRLAEALQQLAGGPAETSGRLLSL